jgi:hypothetical protein
MAVKGVCVVTAVHWAGVDDFNINIQYCSANSVPVDADTNLNGISPDANATQMENAIKDYVKQRLIEAGVVFSGGDTVRLIGAIS